MDKSKLILPISILLGCIILGGFYYASEVNKQQQLESRKEQSENQKVEITRKTELELEGFINDYFFRRQIKDPILFFDFDAYGSVLSKSIVIYIYPKKTLSTSKINDIKETLDEGLHTTLLDFSDFNWAKEYTFNIVIR